MGYTTRFTGQLNFTTELTASQLAHLKQFLGADVREHDWEIDSDAHVTYMDLELTDDFSGLKWDGSEKTYGMPEIVNIIVREMRKFMPEFGLSGSLSAQGERFDDRWTLVIGSDGFAKSQEILITGQVVECPHCGEKFELESR